MKGRKLLAWPNVTTFAPAADITEPIDDEYPLCNLKNLGEVICQITWDNPDIYEAALSVIQSISTIRKGKRSRDIQKVDSRGANLKSLEDSSAKIIVLPDPANPRMR